MEHLDQYTFWLDWYLPVIWKVYAPDSTVNETPWQSYVVLPQEETP